MTDLEEANHRLRVLHDIGKVKIDPELLRGGAAARGSAPGSGGRTYRWERGWWRFADAFDAMRRETPCRQARTEAGAISELEAEAGAQFDPRIVRLFVAAVRDAGDPRRAGS